MKMTKKLLIIGTIFAVVASLGMLQTKVFADDDGYEEVPGDLNNVTVDDGTEETNTTNTTTTNEVKNTTNTTNTTTTNTTNNVVSLNTTNTANEAKTNHPQAGNFTEAKVIAGVSVAVIALAFAFAKMKKYSY